MDKEKYKKLTSKIVPKEDRLKNAIVSFLVGGLVGGVGEIIGCVLTKYGVPYKSATSIMIVILIFVASLLTALGVFDDLVCRAKAGLIIPITGFAHSITSSMIDYKKEGLVTGIGANAFKLAGTVILYGVVSAYVFGAIRFMFFGG